MTANPQPSSAAPAPTTGVAGTALDVEVARVVFKIKRLYDWNGRLWTLADEPYSPPHYIPSGKPWRTHRIDARPVPRYSTDISAAWIVVERLLGMRVGPLVVINVDVSAAKHDPDESATFTCLISVATPLDALEDDPTTFEGIEAAADTPSLAICRAALRAIEDRAEAGGGLMEPMVVIPLRVFSALIVALDRGQTKLGHPAQVVGHESMGMCSPRHGCSTACPERRALFMESVALEDRAYEELDAERLEQLPFAATASAGVEGSHE